jgi:trehalose 6-phosphate synthase/phosphatase
MNLVAKEYCTCSVDDGVLILSEFAGAAAQLQHGALLVNPYDVKGVADALYLAVNMDRQERLNRMRLLRRSVGRQNVFWWVDAFLRAAISADLSAFPHVEVYVPQAPSDAADLPEEQNLRASLNASGL